MKFTAPNLNNPLVNATGRALDEFRLWILARSKGLEYRAITDPGTSDYTITEEDFLINVTTAGVTVTALTAVDIKGQVFEVKNSSAGNITFNAATGETIDGTNSWTIGTMNAMKVISDGANLLII